MKRLLLGAALVFASGAVCAQTVEGEEHLFPGERLEALSYGTVGPSPQTVVPPGSYALSIEGDFNLGGFVFKDGVPFIHNEGGASYGNTAVGLNALRSVYPHTNHSLEYYGSGNSAFGHVALTNNTNGTNNTASGLGALYYNADGVNNTASGVGALFWNTTGRDNTAIGFKALHLNTTGKANTAIGYKAGYSWTTGYNNIAIGRGAYGLPAETDTIRIGGNGQSRTFINGIIGHTAAAPVCIDAGGRLGTCDPSSLRFKEAIETMGDTATKISSLRPVTFRYKPKTGVQPDGQLQYGLIAEEVAKVLPTLVSYDDEGKPYTVRYSLLTPLLLNELQRQHRWNEEQATEIRRLTARLDRLESTEPP